MVKATFRSDGLTIVAPADHSSTHRCPEPANKNRSRFEVPLYFEVDEISPQTLMEMQLAFPFGGRS